MISPEFSSSPVSVEEVQGLYGTLYLRETILQKIWDQGLFQQNALKLRSGEFLKILNRGDLNLLEGPDFKNAHILINERSIHGDIEVHLSESHWEQHQHQYQKSYSNVCLHVFLFSAKNPISPKMPSLNLLPYLYQDLESYIEEYSLLELVTPVKNITHPNHVKILNLSPQNLQKGAYKRWLQKVNYAQARIDRWGFQEAIYQFFCEILGYKRNRLPMSQLSLQFPIPTWHSNPPDPQSLFAHFSKQWKQTGIRPQNHPKKRLKQLFTLMTQHPDWIKKMNGISLTPHYSLNEAIITPKTHRKTLSLSAFRKKISDDILGGVIAGTRLDTLIIDGILPLLAASKNQDYFFHWFSWYSGDIPEQVQYLWKHNDAIKSLNTVNCNGWNQSVLFALNQLPRLSSSSPQA